MAHTEKIRNQQRRKRRVRAQVIGTSERPRLTAHVSLRHISAQIIDDSKGVTIAASDSRGANTKGSLTERSGWVGKDIAERAKKAKVTKVVFDRNGRKYHGRLKELAEQARAGGLEF